MVTYGKKESGACPSFLLTATNFTTTYTKFVASEIAKKASASRSLWSIDIKFNPDGRDRLFKVDVGYLILCLAVTFDM